MTADSVRVRIKRALGEKSVAMVQIVLNIENTYLYLTHESKMLSRRTSTSTIRQILSISITLILTVILR